MASQAEQWIAEQRAKGPSKAEQWAAEQKADKPAHIDADEPSKTEKYARSTAAELMGGTAAALPGLAALATGTAVTLGGRGKTEDSNFLTRLGTNVVFDKEGNVRDTINAAQKGMQWGYDQVESDNYKRDVTAYEGEEGYLPPDEELIGTIISALVPLGLIGKAGKGSQLLTKAAKTAAKVPGVKPAATIAEFALPGFTGGPMRAAANVAVDSTMVEASRGFAGEDTVSGVFETEEQKIREALQESALPGYADAPMSKAEAWIASQDETGATVGKTLAAGGGAMVAATATGMALRGKGGRALANTKLGKEAVNTSRDFNTAFNNSTAPVTRTVEVEKGAKQAQEMQAVLDRNIGSASDHHVENANQFGALTEDNSISTKVPYNRMEEFYRAQSKQARDDFDDVLQDAVLVQQLRNIDMDDAQKALYSDRMRNKMAHIKKMEKDPAVGSMLRMWKDYTDAYSEFRYRHGIISEAQYKAETAAGHYYMPLQAPRRESSTLTGFTKRFFTSGSRGDPNNPRWISRFEKERATGGVQKKEKVDTADIETLLNMPRQKPFEVGRDYNRTTIKYTRANTARMDFIDRMKDSKKIKKLNKGEKSKNTIQIMRNGELERYDVKDVALYHALQFRPHYIMPGMAYFRRMAQQGATGNLNPTFAPISLLYDATMGMLTANLRHGHTGRIDAFIDNKLAARGISESARNGVRTILSPLRLIDTADVIGTGIYQGVVGRMAQLQAMNASRRLRIDPNNIRMQESLKRAMDRFYSTTYGEMVGNGYTSSRFESEPLSNQGFKHIDAITRKITNTRGYTMYDGMLSTIRDAYRVGLYARNTAAAEAHYGRKLTPKERHKVSSFVRNAAVDTSKTGSNPVWTGILSTVPYGNVTARSLVHLVNSMRDPATMGVLTTVAAIAAYAREDIRDELGEDALTDWYLRTPGYDQSATIPFRVGNEIVSIPLGIELGALVSVVTDVMRDAWDDKASQEILADDGSGSVGSLKGALARLANIAVPPPVDAVYSMTMGSRIRPGDLLTGEDPFRSELRNQAGLQGEQRYYGANSGYMPDWAAQLSESLLGTFGRTIAEGIEMGIDQDVVDDGAFYNGLSNLWEVPAAAAKHAAYTGASRYSGLWNKSMDMVGAEGAKVVSKDGQFTPMTQKVYEVDNALKEFRDLHMQHINTGLGRGTNPYRMGQQVDIDLGALPIALPPDSPLRAQMQLAARYFGTHNRYVQRQRINTWKREMESIKGSVQGTYSERMEKINEFNTKIQNEYEVLLDAYGRWEAQMKQAFGEDWSLDKLATAVGKELSLQRQPNR